MLNEIQVDNGSIQNILVILIIIALGCYFFYELRKVNKSITDISRDMSDIKQKVAFIQTKDYAFSPVLTETPGNIIPQSNMNTSIDMPKPQSYVKDIFIPSTNMQDKIMHQQKQSDTSDTSDSYDINDDIYSIDNGDNTVKLDDIHKLMISNSDDDDNKSDDNKSDDNKSDDNKSDDNMSDDNMSDDNMSDDNMSDDNKSDGNKSDGNMSDGNKSDGNKSDGNKSDGNKSDGNKSDGIEKYKLMTVNQLKVILDTMKLPVSGNKTKLISRILDNQ